MHFSIMQVNAICKQSNELSILGRITIVMMVPAKQDYDDDVDDDSYKYYNGLAACRADKSVVLPQHLKLKRVAVAYGV